jgi:hypothetical protein
MCQPYALQSLTPADKPAVFGLPVYACLCLSMWLLASYPELCPCATCGLCRELEPPIEEGAERLWCSQMMTCLSDVFPLRYTAKVQSLAHSGSTSQFERLDNERFLDMWGTMWFACWRDLPCGSCVVRLHRPTAAHYSSRRDMPCLSDSLAHLAVPHIDGGLNGGWQDSRFEPKYLQSKGG